MHAYYVIRYWGDHDFTFYANFSTISYDAIINQVSNSKKREDI